MSVVGQFKADRLQMIVVAKKYICVGQCLTIVGYCRVTEATPDLSSQIRPETETTKFIHKLLDAKVSGSTFFKQP